MTLAAPAFEITRAEDRTTARLTGCPRLTEENVVEVGRQLARLTEGDGPDHVELDFAEVEYLTSAVLMELVQMSRRLRGRGGRVSLVNARPFVREVLAVTGVDRLLDVAPPPPR